jgi:pimeloyl-ACP methyl ester carboxylesterase
MAFGGAWGGLAKQLGDDFTLVAPDMPSHGASVDWDEVSDFGDTVYAASLAAMDDTPMDVIGHSFGAVTALRIAAMHPEKVRSLTVIEPVFFAVALAFTPEAMGQHDDNARPFLEAIQAGEYENAARAFNKMWSTEAPKWDSLPERSRAAMARAIHVVPDQHAFLFDDAAGLLETGKLDSFQGPTLVMQGALAHSAIVATNEGLIKIMPNAIGSVIEGAGHMAPISHPKPVAEALSELFARS